jgi:WD40 repeat protein
MRVEQHGVDNRSQGETDMPRTERPLDSEDTELGGFAADLRTLRDKAGKPSYRALASRAHYSAATLSDAAGGKKLPSLAVTLAYVRACDGDEQEWEQRWRAIAAPPDPTGEAPYVGLQAFQKEDADRFFGREKLTAKLADLVASRPLVGVFGASGSGKSSLLRAGLLPRLDQALIFTPGVYPLDECAVRLAQATSDSAVVLRSELTDPAALGLIARRHDLVLVVDQFEEIFTECRDDDTGRAFVQALQAAADRGADGGRPAAVVLVVVRSDFHGACTGLPALARALAARPVVVGPVTRGALADIVALPARAAGLALGDGLVETVLADADAGVPLGRGGSSGAGVLPLLSHALYTTWQGRRPVRDGQRWGYCLTVEDYVASGRIRGALAASADAVYAQLGPAEQAMTTRVLLDLVQVVQLGEVTLETRRRARRADLARPGDPPGALDRVLQAFAAARILTLDEDEVEIAHEALLTAWDRLQGWLQTARAWMPYRQQILQDAQAWSAVDTRTRTGRRLARERLYPSARLALERARMPAQGHPLDLPEQAVRFLAASDREGRRRHAVRRGVASALVTLLAVTSLLAAWLQVQIGATDRERDQAVSEQLAMQADQLRMTDPPVSHQVSAAAYRLAPTTEALSSLLTSQADPPETRLVDHVGQTWDLAVSVDGRLLATAGMDGRVRLWQLAGSRPQPIASVPVPGGGVFSVAISPDGRRLAAGGRDGQVRLWNLRDPRRPVPTGPAMATHRGTVYALAFSRDGATLASGSGSGQLWLWDVRDGAQGLPRSPVAKLTMPGSGPVFAVAFSPAAELLMAARDTAALMWDVTHPGSPRAAGRPLAGHTASIRNAAFSRDGRTLATAGMDDTVRLWAVDQDGGSRPLGAPMAHHNAVYGVAFSGDGTLLASTGNDNTTRVWQVDDGRSVATYPSPLPGQRVAFLGGADVLAAVGNDGMVRLLSLSGRRIAVRQHAPVLAAWTKDTRLLATGSIDGSVDLWRTSDPRRPRWAATLAPSRREAVQRLEFSADGRLLAVPAMDGRIELWDVTDPVHPVRQGVAVAGRGAGTASVAFQPGGRLLAAANLDGSVDLWDVANPTRPVVLRTLTDEVKAALDVAFSPDGTMLATVGADATTRLYAVAEPRAPRLLASVPAQPAHGLLAVTFSPDGRTLAAAGEDGTVQVADLSVPSRPKVAAVPPSNAGAAILDLAFVSTGLLAAAQSDGTTWLWDIAAATPGVRARLAGHTREVFSVAAGSGSAVLMTAGGDGTVVLWELDPVKVIREMCQDVGTLIHGQERSRYLSGRRIEGECG